MNKKFRTVGHVPDKTWNRFRGYAKLNGLTHPEFLERLLRIYENYLKNTQIQEKEEEEEEEEENKND